MIQRLQTIWLLLASSLAFVSLKTSFFSGNKMVQNLQTNNNEKFFVPFTGMSHLLIMILTVGIGILSLVNIFFYKNRATQLKLAFAAILASIATIALYFWQTKNYIPQEGSLDLTALIVFFIPAILILAIRGIYKDEKLVKSTDRLR